MMDGANRAAPGSFLQKYVDRVSEVPTHLRRHLALIRDLDEKVQTLQSDIERRSKKHLSTEVTQLTSLADEKVTIAAQVYDFIDSHIQSLDEDLRLLDAEIRADKERLGVGEDETAGGRLEARRTKGRGRVGVAAAAAAAAPDKKKKGGRKRTLETEEEDGPSSLLPMPTENEPVYCYCQKPSHGQMVACDNDECQLEWFHLECVGLTAAPTGEWLCPDCRASKDKETAAG